MSTFASLQSSSVTLRPALDDDEPAIARVAELDSAQVPAGALLVGIVDGRLAAIVSIDTGAVVADPFAPTAEVVGMLRERAERIRNAAGAPRGRVAALWTSVQNAA